MRNVAAAKNSCLFTLVLCLAGLLSSQAAAQSISITQIQQLAFPKLALSGSGNVNLCVSPLNSSTSGNAQIVSGSASRGQYALSLGAGGSPVSISIDISDASTGNAGLTLDTFRGFYSGQSISSFPSSTLPLPAASPGNTPLYLGAKVTANPTLPAGSYTASFTITVFIQ